MTSLDDEEFRRAMEEIQAHLKMRTNSSSSLPVSQATTPQASSSRSQPPLESNSHRENGDIHSPDDVSKIHSEDQDADRSFDSSPKLTLAELAALELSSSPLSVPAPVDPPSTSHNAAASQPSSSRSRSLVDEEEKAELRGHDDEDEYAEDQAEDDIDPEELAHNPASKHAQRAEGGVPKSRDPSMQRLTAMVHAVRHAACAAGYSASETTRILHARGIVPNEPSARNMQNLQDCLQILNMKIHLDLFEVPPAKMVARFESVSGLRYFAPQDRESVVKKAAESTSTSKRKPSLSSKPAPSSSSPKNSATAVPKSRSADRGATQKKPSEPYVPGQVCDAVLAKLQPRKPGGYAVRKEPSNSRRTSVHSAGGPVSHEVVDDNQPVQLDFYGEEVPEGSPGSTSSVKQEGEWLRAMNERIQLLKRFIPED
jgi:hypothetical protein